MNRKRKSKIDAYRIPETDVFDDDLGDALFGVSENAVEAFDREDWPEDAEYDEDRIDMEEGE